MTFPLRAPATANFVDKNKKCPTTSSYAFIAPEPNVDDTELNKSSDSHTQYSEDHKYSRLQAALFASLIGDSLDKIKILGHLGGLPNVEASIDFQPLAVKYAGEQEQNHIFDPDTLEPYEGSALKQMLIKFQKDRSFIEKILIEVHNELISDYSTENFNMCLDHIQKLSKEKEQLLRDTAKNTATLDRLSEQMESDKIALLHELEKRSELLWQTKNYYEDRHYERDIKYKYVDRWENGRCSQNNFKWDRKLEAVQDIINEFQDKYDKENLINNDIENFLNETTYRHENDIQVWRDKYSEDMEAKEMEVEEITEKRNDQLEVLQSVTAIYEVHKKEIEDWLEIREQLRMEAELLQRMNEAATKIQAWWKGTMYRKGLYGKRKRKKKGKKKDKNKKGQKKK